MRRRHMRASKLGRWVARTSVTLGLGVAIAGTAAVLTAGPALADAATLRDSDATVSLVEKFGPAKTPKAGVILTPADDAWD
jgi:hypothetical protein